MTPSTPEARSVITYTVQSADDAPDATFCDAMEAHEEACRRLGCEPGGVMEMESEGKINLYNASYGDFVRVTGVRS